MVGPRNVKSVAPFKRAVSIGEALISAESLVSEGKLLPKSRTLCAEDNSAITNRDRTRIVILEVETWRNKKVGNVLGLRCDYLCTAGSDLYGYPRKVAVFLQ